LQDLFSTHTDGGHFHPLLASFNTLQFTSGKVFQVRTLKVLSNKMDVAESSFI
jgi:hypothetical protein